MYMILLWAVEYKEWSHNHFLQFWPLGGIYSIYNVHKCTCIHALFTRAVS